LTNIQLENRKRSRELKLAWMFTFFNKSD